MINNFIDLDIRKWKQLQSIVEESEIEKLAKKQLDETNTTFEVETNLITKDAQAFENFSIDLLFLLNNERFIFENNEFYSITNVFITIVSSSTLFDNLFISFIVLFSQEQAIKFNFNVFNYLDFDNDDSLRHITFYVSTHRVFESLIVDVSKHKFKYEISNFALDIAIWCEMKDITRLDYASLREVLKLKDISIEHELSQTLSTLLSWSKHRLSLSSLQKFKISIKMNTMSSNIVEATTNMYHINFQYLVAMLLSAFKSQERMHFDMTNIVDCSSQLWHANCWASSIRTCSTNYAIYVNDIFIFSSNFVRFWNLCSIKCCHLKEIED